MLINKLTKKPDSFSNCRVYKNLNSYYFILYSKGETSL